MMIGLPNKFSGNSILIASLAVASVENVMSEDMDVVMSSLYTSSSLFEENFISDYDEGISPSIWPSDQLVDDSPTLYVYLFTYFT